MNIIMYMSRKTNKKDYINHILKFVISRYPEKKNYKMIDMKQTGQIIKTTEPSTAYKSHDK